MCSEYSQGTYYLLDNFFCSITLTFAVRIIVFLLTVGYVSSDIGNHPLSHLMQSGESSGACVNCSVCNGSILICLPFATTVRTFLSVFGLHDRSKFEVTVYALNPSDSSRWRSKIEAGPHKFKDVSQVRRRREGVELPYSG